MSPIYRIFNTLTHYSPEAQAIIHGSPKYASISGTALFYPFFKIFSIVFIKRVYRFGFLCDNVNINFSELIL